MPNMKPIDSSSPSMKTRPQIAKGFKKLSPQAQGETTYIIHDAAGLELGEAAGATQAQALVALYKMDGIRLSLGDAEETIRAGSVTFTVVA